MVMEGSSVSSNREWVSTGEVVVVETSKGIEIGWWVVWETIETID